MSAGMAAATSADNLTPVGAVAATTGAAASADNNLTPVATDPSIGEITEVLQRYFDGLHHSDVPTLAGVFHPLAAYSCATDGSLVHLSMAEYFPIVAARVSPAARGEARHDAIVSIDLAGPVTALARVTCSIGPKRFTDLLSLVRLEGRWQIIAKVFHFDVDVDVDTSHEA